LVKSFEGFSKKAYICPAGVLTIGYGHTEEVYVGQTITKEEAILLLIKDLTDFESVVKHNVKVPLSQNQFDALVSWTFNVGAGALESSTLLKVLNRGKYDEVPEQMKRWVYADGIELRGLINRREKEAKLWSNE
jgi:lysozyme